MSDKETSTLDPEAPEVLAAAIRKATWGKVIDGERVYELHEAQSAILTSNKRFLGAIAGTGGGKTALGPLWVMKQIQRVVDSAMTGERDLRQEPLLGMVVAPTHPIKARATAPTLVAMLKGTDFEGVYTPSTLQYVLPGCWLPEGTWLDSIGTIWVLSADNPDGLEGGQFDFIWADEAGQFKYGAMVAIEGRTGLKQAPVLLTSTPYGMNWMKYKFLDRAKNGDPQYFVRQWKSIDNPAYPKEEYERARRSMSPARFNQRYNAQFARMSGLVYPDIQSCRASPALVLKMLEEPGRRFGGLDFGWNDPFCCLAAHQTADQHLWIWFERYKRKCPIGEHASRIPLDVIYWADPSRPDHIRELQVASHSVRKANNDIVLGVDAVNARIYAGTLHISEVCTALWAEAEEYRYPEKDDEAVGDKPIDSFNHAMDPLRYMIMGIDRRQMADNAAA